MSGDSIRRRYVVTLLAQGVTLALGMLTASLVPRALGPANYGNFQFLYSAISGLKATFDSSVSSAFFTWTSKHHRGTVVLRLWFVWEVLQLIALAVFLVVLVATGGHRYLWPDQPVQLIGPVAVFVVIAWYGSLLERLADAKSYTVQAKIGRTIVAVLQSAALALLFVAHRLGLYSYVSLLIATNLAITGVVAWVLWRRRADFLARPQDTTTEAAAETENPQAIRAYLWRYCSPLVLYGAISWGTTFADRWILQKVGGSQEQGYYSLAFNWSQILLIFASAALSIYWREVSAAHGAGDTPRIAFLYKRFTYSIFLAVCYLATFVSWHADFLVQYVAGAKFADAALPLALMAYYPVHQVYGQLSSVLMLATDRTRIYTYIGYVALALSLVGAYLFMAPRDFAIPGLELGAYGLAIRMIGLQFLIVNIYAAVNCRTLKISFARMLGHQLLAMGSMFALTLLASGATAWAVEQLPLSPIPRAWGAFVASGMLYTALAGGLVWLAPGLTGLRRDELRQMLTQVLSKLRSATS